MYTLQLKNALIPFLKAQLMIYGTQYKSHVLNINTQPETVFLSCLSYKNKLASAQLLSNNCTMLSFPFSRAKRSGLTPSVRHGLTFAPLLSKSLTTLSCPSLQARNNGLAPFLSHEFMVDPLLSKSFTML